MSEQQSIFFNEDPNYESEEKDKTINHVRGFFGDVIDRRQRNDSMLVNISLT